DMNVYVFFFKYDDERSGSFEPLRFVPKGKIVVLGLLTSKKGALEKKDDVKRRIDAATNTSTSISWRFRHNADSPRHCLAIFCPRTSSSLSSRLSSKSPGK